MKVFEYYKNNDYGEEHNFTLLKGKKYSLFHVSFGLEEYPSMPYLAISFGYNRLIAFHLSIWKFTFYILVLGRT